MNFILSPHAEEKIIQRQISLKILQDILNNPEQILEEDGLKVYQGTFVAINNKTYLLRIYINDLVEPQKIVTLYVTSKLRKYRQLSNES
ncbi:MAG: DUF4258 domain-containing protein [Microcystis sp. M49629_WE12]|nr:DUF4258 domain-containing protein [Microcystis aeruginosa WS75]MDJ0565234.1 DUF4258 domain-containing protein [Microcystis sp. M49629_WE12]NCR45887.1 DUF4258 domain-containing protein [Microcystis aeruginosa SX13-01]NCR68863.1 DUF4258 domain-containing protein [Microcystis aeruginosa LL11-07]NCR91469.1 DUF4258 domain-containing protein [Microcystis aeruginosa G13-10]NCS17769.1 DUF4258 domain-containing protein [Microcystis aeruginosa G13-12]NCS20455.1 DUF4258 domain-containing protein [Mic